MFEFDDEPFVADDEYVVSVSKLGKWHIIFDAPLQDPPVEIGCAGLQDVPERLEVILDKLGVGEVPLGRGAPLESCARRCHSEGMTNYEDDREMRESLTEPAE